MSETYSPHEGFFFSVLLSSKWLLLELSSWGFFFFQCYYLPNEFPWNFPSIVSRGFSFANYVLLIFNSINSIEVWRNAHKDNRATPWEVSLVLKKRPARLFFSANNTVLLQWVLCFQLEQPVLQQFLHTPKLSYILCSTAVHEYLTPLGAASPASLQAGNKERHFLVSHSLRQPLSA